MFLNPSSLNCFGLGFIFLCNMCFDEFHETISKRKMPTHGISWKMCIKWRQKASNKKCHGFV